MKQSLLSSVAGVALTSMVGAYAPARAQQPPLWNGAYLGLYAGVGWARSQVTTTSDCNSFGLPYYCDDFTPQNGAAVGASGTGIVRDTAFVGGMHGGYNIRLSPNWMTGVEADFGAFLVRAKLLRNGTYPANFAFVSAGDGYTVGVSVRTQWLATIRGRIGTIVYENFLIYVTGGLAMTELTVRNTFTDVYNAPTLLVNSSRTRFLTGWTVGGGGEWALNNRWSIKAEYLFVQFGSVRTNGSIDTNLTGGYGQGISTIGDLAAHMLRIGFNYRY